jgi:26S proteasome regulatory subunit N1
MASSNAPEENEQKKEAEKPVVNGVKKDDTEELSEEDQNLKNELELLVERLKENDDTLYPAALESLKTLIRTSTSSMTAVPKPLKFLRPYYPDLQKRYEEWPTSPVKESFADVLSVLGMTYSDDETLDSLKYRLLAPTPDPSAWGHEYVRHLASEIGIAYNKRLVDEPEKDTDDLLQLAKQIIPFLLSHNAEPDAVDLLSELNEISLLPEYVDENNWERVVAYVVACVPLLTQDDDRDFLLCARAIYKKYGKLVEAMTLSIRLDSMEFIEEDFAEAKDEYS